MTRRAAGEGSVYRRSGDGLWVGSVQVDYRDGKRVRRYLYAKSRQKLRAKLDEARRAHEAGLPIPSEQLTVAAFLADWLRAVQPALRPRTFESYSAHVRLYISPELGRLPLARLSPVHVQRMLAKLQERGLSAQTVVHVRATLRRSLRDASRWGLVHRNVAALTDPPRVARQELRPLTPEQVRALLDHVRGDEDRAAPLYTVLVATGLRLGEALGLAWEDVDLEARTLTVRHALQRVGGRAVLVEPKTDRSRRTVGLPPVAVAALREHRKRQLQERLLAGSRWRGEEWPLVFLTTIGTPVHGPDVTRGFQAKLAAAGLPRVTLHSLRHSAATFLLAQGVSPRVVMEMLGHSTIQTTMTIYSHVIDGLRRDAADRMEEVLTGQAR